MWTGHRGTRFGHRNAACSCRQVPRHSEIVRVVCSADTIRSGVYLRLTNHSNICTLNANVDASRGVVASGIINGAPRHLTSSSEYTSYTREDTHIMRTLMGLIRVCARGLRPPSAGGVQSSGRLSLVTCEHLVRRSVRVALERPCYGYSRKCMNSAKPGKGVSGANYATTRRFGHDQAKLWALNRINVCLSTPTTARSRNASTALCPSHTSVKYTPTLIQ